MTLVIRKFPKRFSVAGKQIRKGILGNMKMCGYDNATCHHLIKDESGRLVQWHNCELWQV